MRHCVRTKLMNVIVVMTGMLRVEVSVYVPMAMPVLFACVVCGIAPMVLRVRVVRAVVVDAQLASSSAMSSSYVFPRS